MPIGMPGWPELAFCTASMESARMALTMSAWVAATGAVAADICSGKKRRQRADYFGKRLENAFTRWNMRLYLRTFSPRYFSHFAWVNLCRKDSTRRPGLEGTPLAKRECPRSRGVRSLLRIFAWGYHDEGTAHHCRSLQLPEDRSPRLFRQVAGSLHQRLHRIRAHRARAALLPVRRHGRDPNRGPYGPALVAAAAPPDPP